MNFYQDIRRGLFKPPQEIVSFHSQSTMGTIGPYTLCPTHKSTMCYDVVVQIHDNSFVSVQHVNVKVIAPGTNVRIEGTGEGEGEDGSFGTEVFAGSQCHVRCGDFAHVVCKGESVVHVGDCSTVQVGRGSRARGGLYTNLIFDSDQGGAPIALHLSEAGEHRPDMWYHVVDGYVVPWSPLDVVAA